MLSRKKKESFSVKKAFSFLLDFLAPSRCPGCGEILFQDGFTNSGWCDSCWHELPWIIPPFCKLCGKPIKGTMCQSCMVNPPPFHRLRSACVYDGVIAKSVIDLKFYRKLHLVKPLTSVLDKCIREFFSDIKIDVIVPVPLHPKRLAERGFNQSVLIGERVNTDGIFLKNGVIRIRYTIPQVRLSGKERRRNLRNVFKVVEDRIPYLKDKTVLIVDDVVTTGTTIVEMAKAVRRVGAKRVMGVTVARAL